MRNDGGMTLVEMIAVLLLMAIVSAVVLNRFMDITAVSATAAAETVKAHLRYAQAMAMKQNNFLWGIKCNGSNYWLFRTEARDDWTTNASDQDTALYLPGEDEKLLPAAAMEAFVVYYDQYGRPRKYDNGKAELFTAADDPLDISIGSESIRVRRETGFIQ